MKVGNRIKELRTKRGLTQEALASALGVTAQTVSKWECEINFPDVSLLPDISVFFGVSIDSLFSMTRSDKFERIENRIAQSGLISDDEVKQIESVLRDDADGADRCESLTLLAKLYNHQAKMCRALAGRYAEEALEEGGGAQALTELTKSRLGAPESVIKSSHRELISYLKGYLGRNPDDADATAALIDNLLADCRVDEANMWTDHLSKIDGTYRPLRYKYAVAERLGTEETSEAAIAVLSAAYADDPEALSTLADIYFKRGEYEKAIGCLLKATEHSPSPKKIDATLAAAHIAELLGNLDDATVMLREAQRILRDEWGIVSGETVDSIRREIKRLSIE